MFAKTSQATDAAPAGYAVNPEISSTFRSAPVRPKYFRKVGRTEAPGVNFPDEVIGFTLIDLDRSGRLAVRVSECNPKGVTRTKFFLPSEVDAYQIEITNDFAFHHHWIARAPEPRPL